MCVIEIREMRKGGRLQEALALAKNKFNENPDRDICNELFWCLHDSCKAASSPAEKMTFYNDAHAIYREHLSYDTLVPTRLGWLIYNIIRTINTNDARARKVMLNNYFNLKAVRPSQLHSFILKEAIALEKDTPLEFRIRDFVKIWGLKNLRDEDWEQFRTDEGRTCSSLVEQLIAVYAKELKTDKVTPSPEFCELIDKALVRYPNSQYMPYYKAVTLIAEDKIGEAIEFYRKLIMRFPNKTYLWEHLSDLIDDADTRIGMLCKAVSTGDDEQFLVKIRLALASLLIDRGMFANAKYELDTYLRTYQANGWHPKQEFYDVANRIPASTTAADNKQFYDEFSRFADKFIYGNIPSKYAVKTSDKTCDDRNRPGRKYIVWTLMDGTKRYTLKKPQKFGLKPRTPNGTFFEFKESDGKIVWISPVIPTSDSDWYRKVEGTVNTRIDRNGKTYCIINDVYVGESLLHEVSEGSQVSVVAMPRSQGRWSAVILTAKD